MRALIDRFFAVYRHRDDNGAAAVVVAVSMTVLMGSAAIVLDAGDIWQERRELVGGVDAAALAAAADFAVGTNGCSSTAAAYLISNAPDASVTACNSTGNEHAGTVTVEADVTVQHAIAQILGRDQTVVEAATTARWGTPSAVRGLRPFALCNGSDGFEAWQASGHSTTQVFRIYYSKDQPDDCGGPAPGNWGMLDFNGGSNSNSETSDWVEFGYDGMVSAPQWISGDPGAFSNTLPIGSIVGKTIHIPVFDDYNQQGGAGADFHIIGFVSIVIHGYKANGPEANRYLDIQFLTAVAAGTCCDGSLDTGTRSVGLCAVEGEGTCS